MIVILLAACLLTVSPIGRAGEVLRVAAASSLQFALPEIVAGFSSTHGIRVDVTYGSSGLFARQIERGAPFDLFLSADAWHVARLVERGLTDGPARLYAFGRLAFYTPRGSPVDAETPLSDLPAEYAAGRLKRFALAHPEHAPYGVAARQALTRSEAWIPLAPTRVIGENVAQAARFLTSGAAEAGLIAASLAMRPQLAERGHYRLVPPSLHAPLEQRFAVLRGARPGSTRFAAWLTGSEARAVLTRHGFGLSG